MMNLHRHVSAVTEPTADTGSLGPRALWVWTDMYQHAQHFSATQGSLATFNILFTLFKESK